MLTLIICNIQMTHDGQCNIMVPRIRSGRSGHRLLNMLALMICNITLWCITAFSLKHFVKRCSNFNSHAICKTIRLRTINKTNRDVPNISMELGIFLRRCFINEQTLILRANCTEYRLLKFAVVEHKRYFGFGVPRSWLKM